MTVWCKQGGRRVERERDLRHFTTTHPLSSVLNILISSHFHRFTRREREKEGRFDVCEQTPIVQVTTLSLSTRNTRDLFSALSLVSDCLILPTNLIGPQFQSPSSSSFPSPSSESTSHPSTISYLHPENHPFKVNTNNLPSRLMTPILMIIYISPSLPPDLILQL